jgi:excisionase family DNA binding protein
MSEASAVTAEDRVLTIKEAAVILRCSPSMCRKLAKAGTLPGLLPRVGSLWRISERALTEWVALQPIREDRLLTISEAADILRMSARSCRSAAERGELPGVLPKVGSEWRINERVLREWIANRAANVDGTPLMRQDDLDAT